MAARDSIERLVCGFRESVRDRRCLVVLVGYADESYDDRIYVLAGWIASVQNWKNFSDEFEQAGLPRTLHMNTERRRSGKRAQKLAAITLKHTLFHVNCVLHQGNYQNIIKGKIPREIDNPYFLLFHQITLAAATLLDRAEIDGTVDWIFDEQGTIGTDANNWYWWLKEHTSPDIKKRLGSTPIFRSDDDLLPLKAADQLAWEIRRHLSQEQPRNSPYNSILESFLAKCGASGNMTGPHLDELVQKLNSGMLLMKADYKLFFPGLLGAGNK